LKKLPVRATINSADSAPRREIILGGESITSLSRSRTLARRNTEVELPKEITKAQGNDLLLTPNSLLLAAADGSTILSNHPALPANKNAEKCEQVIAINVPDANIRVQNAAQSAFQQYADAGKKGIA
jgi:hypothetical protein